ncbi:MAG: hypothetical protein JSV64_07765 [Candidatus Bathyarchaeota archaeon]|jgi:hypothetical protein|nr:MAG: hypothetical protein JSV64_07765 [Candidatus Bathyarchaeota archaeon]
MADITEYMRKKIAEFRFGRFIGEIFGALGSCAAIVGLLLKTDLLAILGFTFLFSGLIISVHYELQRLDYTHALEHFAHRERQ